MNRRDALRTGAAGALGLGIITNGVMGKESTRLVGIEYNPRTVEVRGEATANFNQRHDRLVGNLELTDKQITFNQAAVSKRPDLKTTKFHAKKGGEHQAINNWYPHSRDLQVHVHSVEGGDIGGYAEHGVKGKKRAFVLRPTSEGKASEIRDALAKKITSGVKNE